MGSTRVFEDLVAIMARLREPDGCPWDREQSYDTLRGYLLEECYEVIQALDDRDETALREELGDLLFQIVFLSRIAQERGAFGIDDVVDGIARKMVRRHPHVFGTERVETSEEVLRNWEAIKRTEKGVSETRSTLDGIPLALPALPKAQRLGAKAARVGFDWEAAADLLDKVDEEVLELRHELAAPRRDEGVVEEVGDLLFTVAMLARRLGLDAERALEATNRKFERRFRALEALARSHGIEMSDATARELDELWQRVKSDQAS